MWQRLRSVAEWYLGVSPTGSGESVRWSQSWGSASGNEVWIVGVIAAALAVIVVLAWQQPGRWSRAWWGLLALRLSALAIVALWLGEWTLHVVRTGLPSLVVLLDTSASMSLEDRYPPKAGGSGAAGDQAQGARLAIAQGLMLADDGAWLRELARRYRVQVYEFAEAAQPVGGTSTAEEVTATLRGIAGLAPKGAETRPGPCLEQVLEEYRGAVPAAAVVFTDGIPSLSADDLLSRARLPSKLGVPLYTVGLGSEQPALDLEIYDLQVDPIIFVGDTASVDVTARGSGVQGRAVQFTVQRDGDPAVLAQTTLPMPADGTAAPVRLAFTPSEEGDCELVITALPIPAEINRENNVLRRRVQARQDRIRVLFVERAPRWEYRHLKAVLERDPNVELRTVLQESDLDHQREDRTALPGFPATRDDLNSYDVVILGDVDLRYLNPGALDLVREFVGTEGGGLILIAGEQHNPAAFLGTPLEPLVPVLPANLRTSSTPDRAFRVAPARSSSDHPLLRLGDGSRTVQFWERLPSLHWAFDAEVRQPGGIVVATRAPPDQRAAVIVQQRYGAGQVLFHATDELWRWRRRVEDRYYGRYWRQAVRYFCKVRRLGRDGIGELTTDRSSYRQGETVQFHLRSTDLARMPDSQDVLSVIVERRSGPRQSVALTPSSESPGDLTGSVPSLPPGDYHAWLAGGTAGGRAPTCEFTVEVPRRELLQQAAELRDLQQAARITGGEAVPIEDVGTLPLRLPHGQSNAVLSSEAIPLWVRGELLLLFVGFLAVDWMFRRSG